VAGEKQMSLLCALAELKVADPGLFRRMRLRLPAASPRLRSMVLRWARRNKRELAAQAGLDRNE
jgi:hypothetical protein